MINLKKERIAVYMYLITVFTIIFGLSFTVKGNKITGSVILDTTGNIVGNIQSIGLLSFLLTLFVFLSILAFAFFVIRYMHEIQKKISHKQVKSFAFTITIILAFSFIGYGFFVGGDGITGAVSGMERISGYEILETEDLTEEEKYYDKVMGAIKEQETGLGFVQNSIEWLAVNTFFENSVTTTGPYEVSKQNANNIVQRMNDDDKNKFFDKIDGITQEEITDFIRTEDGGKEIALRIVKDNAQVLKNHFDAAGLKPPEIGTSERAIYDGAAYNNGAERPIGVGVQSVMRELNVQLKEEFTNYNAGDYYTQLDGYLGENTKNAFKEWFNELVKEKPEYGYLSDAEIDKAFGNSPTGAPYRILGSDVWRVLSEEYESTTGKIAVPLNSKKEIMNDPNNKIPNVGLVTERLVYESGESTAYNPEKTYQIDDIADWFSDTVEGGTEISEFDNTEIQEMAEKVGQFRMGAEISESVRKLANDETLTAEDEDNIEKLRKIYETDYDESEIIPEVEEIELITTKSYEHGDIKLEITEEGNQIWHKKSIDGNWEKIEYENLEDIEQGYHKAYELKKDAGILYEETDDKPIASLGDLKDSKSYGLNLKVDEKGNIIEEWLIFEENKWKKISDPELVAANKPQLDQLAAEIREKALQDASFDESQKQFSNKQIGDYYYELAKKETESDKIEENLEKSLGNYLRSGGNSFFKEESLSDEVTAALKNILSDKFNPEDKLVPLSTQGEGLIIEPTGELTFVKQQNDGTFEVNDHRVITEDDKKISESVYDFAGSPEFWSAYDKISKNDENLATNYVFENLKYDSEDRGDYFLELALDPNTNDAESATYYKLAMKEYNLDAISTDQIEFFINYNRDGTLDENQLDKQKVDKYLILKSNSIKSQQEYYDNNPYLLYNKPILGRDIETRSSLFGLRKDTIKNPNYNKKNVNDPFKTEWISLDQLNLINNNFIETRSDLGGFRKNTIKNPEYDENKAGSKLWISSKEFNDQKKVSIDKYNDVRQTFYLDIKDTFTKDQFLEQITNTYNTPELTEYFLKKYIDSDKFDSNVVVDDKGNSYIDGAPVGKISNLDKLYGQTFSRAGTSGVTSKKISFKTTFASKKDIDVKGVDYKIEVTEGDETKTYFVDMGVPNEKGVYVYDNIKVIDGDTKKKVKNNKNVEAAIKAKTIARSNLIHSQASRAMRSAVSRVLQRTLGKFANEKIAEMCEKEYEASEPISDTPIHSTFGGDIFGESSITTLTPLSGSSSPDIDISSLESQEVLSTCIGDETTITAQGVKIVGAEGFEYGTSFTILTCKDRMQYGVFLSNSKEDRVRIALGYAEVGIPVSETNLYGYIYSYNQICVLTSNVEIGEQGEVCFDIVSNELNQALIQ